jgi:hypothetical protein
LGAWPEADRRAWNRAIADGDIFGRGPAAHWAQTTRNAVVAAYGRWLGFLAEYEPSVLNEDPILRLTGDRLARYTEHLIQTTGSVGRHAYLAHLRDAIRVMCPGKVPPVLSQLVARLERECRPQSKAERIVMSPRLVALGMKLMRGAAGADGEIANVVAFRDGLMIALLAVRPIRRRTFALTRIGKHLRQIGEEWRLVFDGSDTKSDQPFEMTVPEQIVPFLKRYLKRGAPIDRRCGPARRPVGRNERVSAQRPGYLWGNRGANPRRIRTPDRSAPLPPLCGDDDCDPATRQHQGGARSFDPRLIDHDERALQ